MSPCRLRLGRAVLAVLVSAVVGAAEVVPRPPTSAASRDETGKVILVLDSGPIGRSDYPEASFAFRQVLIDAHFPGPMDVFVDTLDLSTFHHPDYLVELRGWLVQKYKRRPVDVVIPVTPEALAFAVQSRPTVWPGARIVFGGVDPEDISVEALPRDVTGITAKVSDFAGTVALARALMPEARRVAFVGARGESYREFLTMSDRYELVDLTPLSLLEIKRRLADIPPGTIVFFDPHLIDMTGNTFTSLTDAVADLASASAAPIFSTVEAFVGAGSVGGMVLRVDPVSREVAGLAARVLHGEDPSTIPISATQSAAPVFDWRQMKKWGLDEARLPPESIVLFRQPTFWEQYRWYAIGALGLIGLQAGLIGGLLVQRTKRRRANAELQHKRDELAHATRAATIGELAASLAHELNQPLAAILSNAEAAEAFLGDDEKPDLGELREILADIRSDDQRAGEIIRRMRSLLTKQPIEVQELDLAQLTSETLELVKSRASLTGVQLWFERAEDIRPVHGDRVQLQQVILNLLVNAIEATAAFPDGSRVVRVRVSRDGRGRVWVAVRDAGPGIPPDQLERVFAPFFTTKRDGLGMGLAIARSIVETHGGRIVVENNPWGGGHFAFTIPRK